MFSPKPPIDQHPFHRDYNLHSRCLHCLATSSYVILADSIGSYIANYNIYSESNLLSILSRNEFTPTHICQDGTIGIQLITGISRHEPN